VSLVRSTENRNLLNFDSPQLVRSRSNRGQYCRICFQPSLIRMWREPSTVLRFLNIMYSMLPCLSPYPLCRHFARTAKRFRLLLDISGSRAGVLTYLVVSDSGQFGLARRIINFSTQPRHYLKILVTWTSSKSDLLFIFLSFLDSKGRKCRIIPNWLEPDADIVRTKKTKNPGSEVLQSVWGFAGPQTAELYVDRMLKESGKNLANRMRAVLCFYLSIFW